MIYAINYANEKYRKAQVLNSKTARLHGADEVIEYSPKDIDCSFFKSNKDILLCERGNGYWLWKPYFINKTLEKIKYGDYIIYSDAGAYYINDIGWLIRCAEKENTDVMVFSLSETKLERIWSKRDAFILIGCDSAEYADTVQRLATFLLLKKTAFTCEFINEWLTFAQDIRIISDRPNCVGKENYADFKENRHDQTILSLLSKKYRINSFRDPSTQREKTIEKISDRSNYPQIFDSHRIGDVSTIDELENRYSEWLGELREQWNCDKKRILYGAGKNADKIISYAKMHNMKIDACVVSDNQMVQESEKEGIRIYHISKMPYFIEDTIIIVTIDSREVIEWLKKENFSFFILNKKCWKALKYFKMQQERIMV